MSHEQAQATGDRLRLDAMRYRDINTIALLAKSKHLLLGIRNHARDELAGVKLEDGQTFTVFTLKDGKIVRPRGHVHRPDALAEAGLADYR